MKGLEAQRTILKNTEGQAYHLLPSATQEDPMIHWALSIQKDLVSAVENNQPQTNKRSEATKQIQNQDPKGTKCFRVRKSGRLIDIQKALATSKVKFTMYSI